jgi:hypothetical protein
VADKRHRHTVALARTSKLPGRFNAVASVRHTRYVVRRVGTPNDCQGTAIAKAPPAIGERTSPRFGGLPLLPMFTLHWHSAECFLSSEIRSLTDAKPCRTRLVRA